MPPPLAISACCDDDDVLQLLLLLCLESIQLLCLKIQSHFFFGVSPAFLYH